MRTYLVTGSAAGIGLATRRLLEARGDKVVGVDLRDAEIKLDLSDPSERRKLSARLDALGIARLDGVVPAAGVGSSADPELIIRLNYFGVLETLAQARPLLCSSDAPRVCIISSIMLLSAPEDETLQDAFSLGEEAAVSAFNKATGSRAYALTKRALAAWARTQAVSEDHLQDRILVNAVAPGLIATAMSARVRADPAALAAGFADVPHPLGIGQPEEVAAVIGFFVSAENSFVNGQIIFVDGGHEAMTCGSNLPRHP